MNKKLDWMMENTRRILTLFDLISKTHELVGMDIFDAKVIEHSDIIGQAYLAVLKEQKDMLVPVDFKEFQLKLMELL